MTTPDPAFSDTLRTGSGHRRTDRGRAQASAGSRSAAHAKSSFTKIMEGSPAKRAQVKNNGDSFDLASGAVVIAAITSCTNTSNPSLMLGAGLLAKKAVERGLEVKPWVKTSLAPGSKVVTDYLLKAGLTEVSRQTEIQPGRLRMHDVHREQRTSAGSDWRGDQRKQSGGGCGAERQSKL